MFDHEQSIGIAAGTYTGDLVVTSPLSLEGRCARDVVVVGSIAVDNTSNVAIRGPIMPAAAARRWLYFTWPSTWGSPTTWLSKAAATANK